MDRPENRVEGFKPVTLKRDGVQRQATSPTHQNQLMFDGWSVAGEDEIEPVDDGLFHPDGHNVPDVKEYLGTLADDDAGTAEYDRVIAEENEGKGRASLVD